MADGDKYEGFGLGFGPYANSVDHYYKSLLGIFDLELCAEILGNKADEDNCRTLIHPYFVSLQEWCRDMYEEKKSDQDKAYFLFRDILVEFKLLKKTDFYEKETATFHKLMTIPISKDGNSIQQLAFVIFEYVNLAVTCLEGYVSRLESTYQTVDKSIKNINSSTIKSKSKLQGFNVKNQDCLKDSYNQLVNLEIISNEVGYLDFEKTFLGHIPEKRLVWLKGPGALSYFIKEINGKGIRDQRKTIWETTVNCFQDINGNDFTVKQLRHGKTPKNVDDIRIVIETFNDYSISE